MRSELLLQVWEHRLAATAVKCCICICKDLDSPAQDKVSDMGIITPLREQRSTYFDAAPPHAQLLWLSFEEAMLGHAGSIASARQAKQKSVNMELRNVLRNTSGIQEFCDFQ